MFKNLTLAAAALLMTACASGTTMVMKPASGAERFSTAKVVPAPASVAVDDEMETYFKSSLTEKLMEADQGFAAGEGLMVEYQFVQYDEGNRAMRYVVGMGAGKGEITIQVTFKDAAGTELSKINVGGEIMMGLAGGSIKQALDRAADQAAEYAVQNFKG